MPLSVLRGLRSPAQRWTQHDSSLAVALTLHEATLCPGCGQPLSESTSPDADLGNRHGAYHYEASLPIRCHACTAVDAAAEPYRGEDVEAPRALRFPVRRVDDLVDLTEPTQPGPTTSAGGAP